MHPSPQDLSPILLPCYQSPVYLFIQQILEGLIYEGQWVSLVNIMMKKRVNCLSGLRMATFSLCPHRAERESKPSGISSYKVTNSHYEDPLDFI